MSGTLTPLEELAAVAHHGDTTAAKRERLVDLALHTAARRARAHRRPVVNAWAATQVAMFAAAEAACGDA